MKKSQSITSVLLLLAFAISPASLAKQTEDEYSKVEITTTEVSKGIYMLMGKGGNIGVSAGDDGVFMIDDQFAPLTTKIKAAIAKISDKPIRFLINTHWHFDHTGGNENMGKDEVVIVAHDNVRQRMTQDNFIEAFNVNVPASPKVALPVITFKDTVTFHLNNQEIQVVHYSNGHTDGDSMVFFKTANVIHMGDNFFNGLYPFIDSSSDGSVNGMIAAVESVLKIADDKTKIIPGHGPLGDKAALVVYRDMLITVRDRMQQLLAEGKTLDEIIALKPNADLDEKWGKEFLNPEAFMKILHSVLPQ
jgi:glyoxylase-like metal-dependent hydrolase (beta-lactamase superfamily II)